MAAFGFMEVLLIVLLSGGTRDLVSLIDAEDFFSLRKVDVQGDKLAFTAAKGAPDSVRRLLAIRLLGERKDAASRATLEEIVRTGKGFDKVYAETALAALDGKPAPKSAPVAGSVSGEGLAWFPADVAMFGSADLRNFGSGGSAAAKSRGFLLKAIPAEQREKAYEVAETLGNIRVDRISFAFSPEPTEHRGRIFVRITGLADAGAIVGLLAKNLPEAKIDEKDGVRTITGFRGPFVAFLGDTEAVICGYMRGQGPHNEVFDQLTAVKSGTKPSVVKGVFAKDLAAVSPQAAGVVMGAVFDELRKDMLRDKPNVAPLNFSVEIGADDKFVRLKGKSEMESADDAGKLLAFFQEQVKKGTEEAGKFPDAELSKVMLTLLGSVKLGSDGKNLVAGIELSREMVERIPSLLMTAFAH